MMLFICGRVFEARDSSGQLIFSQELGGDDGGFTVAVFRSTCKFSEK